VVVLLAAFAIDMAVGLAFVFDIVAAPAIAVVVAVNNPQRSFDIVAAVVEVVAFAAFAAEFVDSETTVVLVVAVAPVLAAAAGKRGTYSPVYDAIAQVDHHHMQEAAVVAAVVVAEEDMGVFHHYLDVVVVVVEELEAHLLEEEALAVHIHNRKSNPIPAVAVVDSREVEAEHVAHQEAELDDAGGVPLVGFPPVVR